MSEPTPPPEQPGATLATTAPAGDGSPAPALADSTPPCSAPLAPSTLDPADQAGPSRTAPAAGIAGSIVGHEIVRELGRGGMGVVYLARDVRLNRPVALKMILAGGHASDTELMRFLSEAEAVASLRHPNVVQVYEIGTHNGLPFFTLEYIPGGALSVRLNGQPLPPADAARLVETIAQGVQAAHTRGIIHRDLKPANVLLEEGPDTPTGRCTPKVADFGLARRLGNKGQTADGALLGTPSYMAPEQAAGQGKQAGVEADVYSLGAILYECLTGRPPFRAATTMETLAQVLHQEPLSVRVLQPNVPRDLETVCLKCLHKEPSRRYASAADLAAELRRFQSGEPILARPVGAVERAWKWCRRRPVVAALLVAVVLSLVAGTAVSSFFAVKARGKQVEAENSRSEAETARARAEQASVRAEQASAALAEDNQQLEQALINSWLAPLSPDYAALTAQEAFVLDQLAQHRGQPLARHFVETALSEAMTAKLRYRAAYAWQAALGLNQARRTEAEGLLLARLRQEGQDSRREDLALAAAELGGLSPQAAAEAAGVIARALEHNGNLYARRYLAEVLATVATHLDADAAATVCRGSAQGFAREIAVSEHPNDLGDLAEGLAVLAAHLPSAEASGLAQQAVERLARLRTPGSSPKARRRLAEGLAALAARLEPAQAQQACREAADDIVQALTRTQEPTALLELSEGLSVLAARLDPAVAAGLLAKVLSQTKDADTAERLARDCGRVWGRLPAGERGTVGREITPRLADTVAQAKQPRVLQPVAGLLVASTAEVEPTVAADAVVQAMSRSDSAAAQRLLAETLSGVADGRRSPEAARSLREAAGGLLGRLRQSKEGAAQRDCAEGLAALAARMDPKESGESCQEAVGQLARVRPTATSASGQRAIAEAVAALAPHLQPVAPRRQACQEASADLVKALAATKDGAELHDLAEGLAALAARLDSAEGAELCQPAARQLAQALAAASRPNDQMELARGLAVLVDQLEPAEAATLCQQGADVLVAALDKTDHPNALKKLSDGLLALTARMAPETARSCHAKAAARLASALTQVNDPDAPRYLPEALSLVAARMADAEAAGWQRQAAVVLVRALTQTRTADVQQELARTLTAVASRLEPFEGASILMQALAQSNDPDPHGKVAEVLSAALSVTLQSSGPGALTGQDVVELLGAPRCVGSARRVVLDVLGRRLGVSFVDQWAFVRYAGEHELGLDLEVPWQPLGMAEEEGPRTYPMHFFRGKLRRP